VVAGLGDLPLYILELLDRDEEASDRDRHYTAG
jgi:hypothetical protein